MGGFKVNEFDFDTYRFTCKFKMGSGEEVGPRNFVKCNINVVLWIERIAESICGNGLPQLTNCGTLKMAEVRNKDVEESGL